MKFTTLKNEPNMGKVWNNDKTVCYGIYGQAGTLLEKGVLYEINAGREMWVFIPINEIEQGQCVPQPSKEALKGFLRLRLVDPKTDTYCGADNCEGCDGTGCRPC